jgi:hypothetical protein
VILESEAMLRAMTPNFDMLSAIHDRVRLAGNAIKYLKENQLMTRPSVFGAFVRLRFIMGHSNLWLKRLRAAERC